MAKISRRHSVLVIVLWLAALLFLGVWRAEGQEAPPDLNMLLDLDLFTSRSNRMNGDQEAPMADSMIAQIRALNALGYLAESPYHPADSGAGNPADLAPPSEQFNGRGIQP